MKKASISNLNWDGRFTHQKAILFDENDLDSVGTKIQVIKIQPNSDIKPHFHKVRTEVFNVVKGRGVICIGEDRLDSNEGDFVLCKPNTVHAFINTGEKEFIVAVFRTNDPGDSDMYWVDKSQ